MGRSRPEYPRFPMRPTRARIDELFAVQRAADPLGHRLHTALAGAGCFLAAFPTTVVEWAALPLLVCFLIRMWTHHRVIGPLAWDRVTWAAVGFSAWAVASAAWSKGGRAWVDDVHNLRMILLIPLLYPVLDRARMLVACLVLGLACGQLSQVAQLAGVLGGVSALDFGRDPSRISGWWDPVIGGSMLTAGLGVCCGIVLERVGEGDGAERRGLVRSPAFAFVMVVAILMGVLLTGTRGAWIASAALVGLVLMLALGRLVRRARRTGAWSRVGGFIAAVAVAAGALGGVYASSGGLRQRVDRGVEEVRGALAGRDYASDTGQRIAMAVWAVREFAAHPVIGVGAGGFKAAAAEMRRAEGGEGRGERLPLPHAHAHSWPLHTLATLGAVGMALLAWMLVAALRSALAGGGGGERGRGGAGGWAAALGLAGLTLAGMFDTIHVNQQTAYLLFVLLALSVGVSPGPWEPPPPKRARAEFRRPDEA